MPVPRATAARSAVQDGAAALLVDVAGPMTFVVEGDDLHGAGARLALARVGDRSGWVAAVGD